MEPTPAAARPSGSGSRPAADEATRPGDRPSPASGRSSRRRGARARRRARSAGDGVVLEISASSTSCRRRRCASELLGAVADLGSGCGHHRPPPHHLPRRARAWACCWNPTREPGPPAARCGSSSPRRIHRPASSRSARWTTSCGRSRRTRTPGGPPGPLLGTGHRDHARPARGVLLGTAAVAAVLVLSPTLWRPTRHVVTIAHEGAHGLVALAAGRRLSGDPAALGRVGLTVSAGRPTGSAWSSPAPRATPARRCSASARPRCSPPGTRSGLLWALLDCSRCSWCRSATGTGCGRCWSPAPSSSPPRGGLPPPGQAAFAALATWFLLLAAPRTVLELQTSRRRRRAPDSDADQLAGLTPFPALFWVGVFLLVDVGALLLGAYWLL